MPELPEIYTLAAQMDAELRGKRVAAVGVRQEKCLNRPTHGFEALVVGKKVGPVTSRGKWVFAALQPGAHFLLNLGMGGEVRYLHPGEPEPEKWQVKLGFGDRTSLVISFWWFGYVHAVTDAELLTHGMTSELGVSPLEDEFTYERFCELLRPKKGALKPVLMDQRVIAGIGNVYLQDILFRARLHPDRKVPSLTEQERRRLFAVIREDMRRMADLGGLVHERDLYGQPGRFREFLIGYREGEPCPECGTTIEKIRTGSTATFVCPRCQRLPRGKAARGPGVARRSSGP